MMATTDIHMVRRLADQNLDLAALLAEHEMKRLGG
jgi:hypothetical protein